MFEINIGDNALFCFTFVERIEEPEDSELDLINCWVEVKLPCIQLQYLCEFTPFELKVFREQLEKCYLSMSSGQIPEHIKFSPRIGSLDIEVRQIIGSDALAFTFRICPDIGAGSELTGGLHIDQSYFPELILGLDRIINS